MIKVEGLTRYYGRFPAVRDVSFTIDDRVIVGFLGLNGAGKSTVLKCLAGLLMPSAGTISIGGVDALELQFHRAELRDHEHMARGCVAVVTVQNEGHGGDRPQVSRG